MSGGTLFEWIARSQRRPSLSALLPELFPDGLRPREVVEISGEQSTGKTMLLTQLISNCILPPEASGLDAEIVLLNLDHHFWIMNLVKIMRAKLSKVYCSQSEVEEILQKSLGKLTVFNIHSTESLIITSHALKKVLFENHKISLVLIDSLSTHYYLDVLAGREKVMDLYSLSLLNSLAQNLGAYEVSIVFTRPAYFQSKGSTLEVSEQLNCININTRVELVMEFVESEVIRRAKVKSKQSDQRSFAICDEGLIWFEKEENLLNDIIKRAESI